MNLSDPKYKITLEKLIRQLCNGKLKVDDISGFLDSEVGVNDIVRDRYKAKELEISEERSALIRKYQPLKTTFMEVLEIIKWFEDEKPNYFNLLHYSKKINENNNILREYRDDDSYEFHFLRTIDGIKDTPLAGVDPESLKRLLRKYL